jgi:hypothetical protein
MALGHDLAMTSVPASRRPTDADVQARIAAALAINEDLLRSALESARKLFDHPGNKGDAVEQAVRSFLNRHLPTRLQIGHGEVIDRFGARSSQLDVIVLNEDQPFNYGPENPAMYVVEGVSAVGEVKSVMGTGELADIVRKGVRFRKLQGTTSGGSALRMTNPSDARRFYVSAPFFAVAVESSMRAESIFQTLLDTAEVPSPEPGGGTLPPVDALFVLNRGVFINFGDGQGAFTSFDPGSGRYQEGWVFHGDQNVLVSLFTWLHATMPRVQRFSSVLVPYFAAPGDASGPMRGSG